MTSRPRAGRQDMSCGSDLLWTPSYSAPFLHPHLAAEGSASPGQTLDPLGAVSVSVSAESPCAAVSLEFSSPPRH